MDCFNTILFIVFNILTVSNAQNFTQFQGFKVPCVDKSPECLKRSLQDVFSKFIHGIPELGITKLDPFKVDSLVLILPGDLTLEFKEAYAKGLQKCIVDYVRQFEGDIFDIQLDCNLLTKGKYRSTGRLFMFLIDGEGHSTIISRNLKIRWNIQLSSIIKDEEQKYIVIKNLKTSHSFEGRVTYNMTNLFKGNPDMSKIVLDFMNQNWYMVANELGSPLINYCINLINHNLNQLLNKVPINNLIIM
ncbi:unnamed protein product [Euphydryas editha]|uniref:Circadian clock-controlled protein-like n=1 Tax=Euphydryas editha TaxID=104508 RepID=A0AAU9TFM7_EUPED|nr:unnamed protein product [Euphydryas editha]